MSNYVTCAFIKYKMSFEKLSEKIAILFDNFIFYDTLIMQDIFHKRYLFGKMFFQSLLQCTFFSVCHFSVKFLVKSDTQSIVCKYDDKRGKLVSLLYRETCFKE